MTNAKGTVGEGPNLGTLEWIPVLLEIRGDEATPVLRTRETVPDEYNHLEFTVPEMEAAGKLVI